MNELAPLPDIGVPVHEHPLDHQSVQTSTQSKGKAGRTILAFLVIALAQVMHREGRFELATPLFDQLTGQARSTPQLATFLHDVLFHAGQNFFDQSRTPEAARCFRESHALRREAGMDELLELSAEAVRVTRAPG